MVQNLMQKSQNLTSINRKIKAIYALDSANQKPKTAFKFISFSQKGCTPRPAPPTRQKLTLFAFRGSASLFRF